MTNEKEWVEQTLDRLEYVEKVMPKESFLRKMEVMATAYYTQSKTVSLPSLIGIAASLLILISVNFVMINQLNSSNQASDSTEIDLEYNLIPTKILYHE